MHVIVAAGNSRKDSCYSSPASAEVYATIITIIIIIIIVVVVVVAVRITVAASNINDQMAYFSNYGECVQIIAPVR